MVWLMYVFGQVFCFFHVSASDVCVFTMWHAVVYAYNMLPTMC